MYLAHSHPMPVNYRSVKKDFRRNKKLLKVYNYVKIFTLLILVGYCSLLCRVWNIPVRILHCRNGTSIISLLVVWFGLCFRKYFTPGNVLSWTNLLGYHNLVLPN